MTYTNVYAIIFENCFYYVDFLLKSAVYQLIFRKIICSSISLRAPIFIKPCTSEYIARVLLSEDGPVMVWLLERHEHNGTMSQSYFKPKESNMRK